MKKPWKKSHICFCISAVLAILYWLLLTLRYGTLTFLPMFLYGGILLLGIICLLHYFQINISAYLPKWLRNTILVLVAIAVIIVSITEAMIIYSGYHEDPASGDTIVVLGAGLVHQDQISLCLLYRLQRAKEEYEKNPDTVILVSGGKGQDEAISEAEAMKRWLVANNVDEKHIITEDQSTNTNENFLFSLEVLKKHGITSRNISLITNRFHMRRAVYLGEAAGFTIHPKPADDLEFAQACYYTREFFGLMRAYLLHY